MKENWKAAFDRVIESEGGYILTNIPGDAGGQTYAGIARIPHRRWEGWAMIDKGQKPSQEMVMQFYRLRFWDLIKGDELPSGIDYLVYDFAVNAGTGQSAKLLQRSVGAVEDCVIGPKTLALVRAQDSSKLIDAFSAQKDAFYDLIVQRNPAQVKFLKGWKNRIAHAKTFAQSMIEK